MIRLTLSRRYFFSGILFVVSHSAADAQADSTQLQIIYPFDSLVISDVKAAGDLVTGAVHISMQIRSDYHKLAQIDFGSGAFGDFGLTDDKGIKYKYSS